MGRHATDHILGVDTCHKIKAARGGAKSAELVMRNLATEMEPGEKKVILSLADLLRAVCESMELVETGLSDYTKYAGGD